MKTVEPLRGKRINEPDCERCSTESIYSGKDIASAVRFYKKYRVSTEHIKENYQLGGVYNVDLWYEYPKLVVAYLKQDKKPYNEWLFDYCFKDVVEIGK